MRVLSRHPPLLLPVLLGVACPGPRTECEEQLLLTPSAPGAFPALTAFGGNEGVLVQVATEVRPDTVLQRLDGCAWTSLSLQATGGWLAGSDPSAWYRLASADGRRTGEAVVPAPVTVHFPAPRDDGAWWSDEEVRLAVEVTLPASLDAPEVWVTRTDGEATTWLQAGVDGPEWQTSEAPFQWDTETTAAVDLPPPLPVPDDPAWFGYEAAVQVTGAAGQTLRIARATADQVLLARTVRWGDLHAHSNLSQDGCEEVVDNCADTAELPGALAFESAVENGQDFAALTDHAEYTLRCDDPDCTGRVVDLWDLGQALVQRAEGTGILPILGYEWTSDPGGHKTVLLAATEACPNWRIGGAEGWTYQKSYSPLTYIGPNPTFTSVPEEFYGLLDAAAETCGPLRVVSFFHHTGLAAPQPVDWTKEGGAIDPRYETVVEIYSEHGSSECRLLESPGCGWHQGTLEGWAGEAGSVQTALALGNRLGFVGGTDGHDGRPGSLEDGPSTTSHAGTFDPDGDGPAEGRLALPWNGGLTGAMVKGDLTRDSLFDAILARTTLATSGPRFPVRVFLRSHDGRVYLPGAEVPAGSGPYRLVAAASDVADAEAWPLLSIEVIDPVTGDVVQETGESVLNEELDLAAGDIRYVRMRFRNPAGADTADPTEYLDPSDPVEDRIWVSPFFLGSGE